MQIGRISSARGTSTGPKTKDVMGGSRGRLRARTQNRYFTGRLSGFSHLLWDDIGFSDLFFQRLFRRMHVADSKIVLSEDVTPV